MQQGGRGSRWVETAGGSRVGVRNGRVSWLKNILVHAHGNSMRMLMRTA